MAELIHLVNDISTRVKIGWVVVLVWGAVQFMWYQRARALPEDLGVEPSTVHDTSVHEADLEEAAGVALESLLDE